MVRYRKDISEQRIEANVRSLVRQHPLRTSIERQTSSHRTQSRLSRIMCLLAATATTHGDSVSEHAVRPLVSPRVPHTSKLPLRQLLPRSDTTVTPTCGPMKIGNTGFTGGRYDKELHITISKWICPEPPHLASLPIQRINDRRQDTAIPRVRCAFMRSTDGTTSRGDSSRSSIEWPTKRLAKYRQHSLHQTHHQHMPIV
jgi:hypothetical protein